MANEPKLRIRQKPVNVITELFTKRTSVWRDGRVTLDIADVREVFDYVHRLEGALCRALAGPVSKAAVDAIVDGIADEVLDGG